MVRKVNLYIDVPAHRVHEITPWFMNQGLKERDVVNQSGWLFGNRLYRVAFFEGEKELAMLFKLSFGGGVSSGLHDCL